MERSVALAYVVDLSGPSPWDELSILEDELEKYKVGMSRRVRIVIANKADLLADDGNAKEVEAAREKLRRLEEFVLQTLAVEGRTIDVIPVSAKFSQNLTRIVQLMRMYVEDAKSRRE